MENQTENSEHRPSQQDIHLPLKYHTLTGCIGCLGGLFIHLVISSLYQWGTINIYVTSYYKTTQDPSITLEGNAVIFPAMMLSIGFTMRLGRFLAKTVGVIKTLYLSNILCAASVFISSFMDSFGGFIAFYGIIFGLSAGLSFMVPIVQCNKFFPGRKMYVNGFILVGTGLGSVIFGNFSYHYINPHLVQPVAGYYGKEIASRVPACLRYLSLLYLIIGGLGTSMMIPVVRHNIEYAKSHKVIEIEENEAQSIKDGICSWVFWKKILLLILATCGVFLVTGNYKTYVKKEIKDDQFLTMIGTAGAIGNGFSRFFWSILFNKTGYKSVMLFNISLCLVVLGTIRFTVLQSRAAYLFLVFVINCCLGGFLVITPIFSQIVFGIQTGSNMYGFFWCTYSLSNFVQFGFISGLSATIGFNNIIYICMGMSVAAIPIVVCTTWEGPWKNPTTALEYWQAGQTSKVANQCQKREGELEGDGEASISAEVMIRKPMEDTTPMGP